MRQIFFILILLVIEIVAFESVCKKLSVSTNIQNAKDDVVQNGIVIEKWNKNTQNPVIATNSAQIDYLYITIEGDNKFLDSNSFSLEFNDHFFANSSVSLVKQQISKHAAQYTLELKYRCKEYGGALINYQLLIQVPECGNALIYWKKICGNPLLTRDGLTVDVQYKKYNQTIVKNGLIVDQSYFDDDLDNYVFQIPANQPSTKFFIYMDLEALNSIDNKEELQEALNDSDESFDESFDDEFQMLEAVLKLIPEVQISVPLVDADTSILKPQIQGSLVNGGLVTNIPQTLELTYNCIEKGDTTIELILPVDYFKDLNFIFIKKCFTTNNGELLGQRKTLNWILTIFFFLEVLGTIYNIFRRKKNGVDAIPFARTLLGLLGIQNSSKNKDKNQSSRTERFPYKSMPESEEFETQFKDENINKQGNYGSI